MTPDDHVLRIHVFVEGNPEPVAATYHLGVRAGKAEISTQIRLARSQTVLALGRDARWFGAVCHCRHCGDARRLHRGVVE